MKFVVVAAVLALSSASVLADPGKDKGKDKDQGQGPAHGSFVANSHANSMGIDHANSHSVLSPVPEADTIAMAVAGLAIVGGVALRRRKQK